MFEPPFMPRQRIEAVGDKPRIGVSNPSRELVTDSRARSDSLQAMTSSSWNPPWPK